MFELTPFVRGNHVYVAHDPIKEMEDMEKRVFGRQLPAFKTDIRETEHDYVLEADLPGFKKEDIHAEIKNGYLNIHAEHKADNDEKNGNYVRRERYYGSYTRSFGIDGINKDGITAQYKDGVLTVTLPKATREEGEQLEIR